MTDENNLQPNGPGDDPGQQEPPKDEIRIDLPEYNPTLDPHAPEFDPAKWQEQAAEAGESLTEQAAQTKEEINRKFQQALRMYKSEKNLYEWEISDATRQIKRETDFLQQLAEQNKELIEKTGLKTSVNSVIEMLDKVRDFYRSLIKEAVKRAFDNVAKALPEWTDTLYDEELQPYLLAEFEKPEYADKTFSDLLKKTDDDGNPLEITLFEQALAAARAAQAADAVKEEPTRTAIKRAKTVEYPLDKPNSIIWRLLEKDTKGQIEFNMAKYGSKQKLPAYYAINFDDLGNDVTITKRLLPFDKLVYIAIAALFNAGNNVITLSQIYYAMGYTGTPGDKDRDKMNDSITKMTAARIFFDNKQEAEKYKYNHFKYDGSLLPLERGTAIVNGRLADAAIHIFREPPLITFAKQRKQITTLDIKLLQAPVSKTDANLQIQDYLLERISKAKNGKCRKCRILYKTLYDHTGITTKKQAQRAPDKIKRYLEYYKTEKFITNFTTETDGITIHW